MQRARQRHLLSIPNVTSPKKASFMKVIKSQYAGPNSVGDFSWMIDRPEYARSLFIFNDNEMQFIAFHTGHAAGFTAGGGNAAIRPYQGHSPIRAAGIPTGEKSGYQQLDLNVRALIDDAMAHIQRLLKSGNYDEVIFSYDASNDTLGTGIFDVADEVKSHIFQNIMALEQI
jgi:hypothetical protein